MLTRFRICNWSSIKLRILTSEHRKLGERGGGRGRTSGYVWRQWGVDNSCGLDHLVTYCSAVAVKFSARRRELLGTPLPPLETLPRDTESSSAICVSLC